MSLKVLHSYRTRMEKLVGHLPSQVKQTQLGEN